MAGRWAETSPDDVSRWLKAVEAPWWIAGGWAIELWLGRAIRKHSDLEIGCFLDDLPAFLSALDGWEIAVARNKQLTPLAGDPARLARPFSLWVRRRGRELWDFEILAEDRDGDRWLYRRDHRISRPIQELTVDAAGHGVIRPEVQLLFKSKDVRPKDVEDFDAAVPALDPEARAWLAEALEVVDSMHPWLGALRP